MKLQKQDNVFLKNNYPKKKCKNVSIVINEIISYYLLRKKTILYSKRMRLTNKLKVQCSKYHLAQTGCASYANSCP